jgi:hypothetical protein
VGGWVGGWCAGSWSSSLPSFFHCDCQQLTTTTAHCVHWCLCSQLHILSQDGDIKLLTQALKTSDNLNVVDGDGMTPLHYAAW